MSDFGRRRQSSVVRDPQSSGQSDPESRDINCDTLPREITQEDSDVIEDSAITVSQGGDDSPG